MGQKNFFFPLCFFFLIFKFNPHLSCRVKAKAPLPLYIICVYNTYIEIYLLFLLLFFVCCLINNSSLNERNSVAQEFVSFQISLGLFSCPVLLMLLDYSPSTCWKKLLLRPSSSRQCVFVRKCWYVFFWQNPFAFFVLVFFVFSFQRKKSCNSSWDFPPQNLQTEEKIEMCQSDCCIWLTDGSKIEIFIGNVKIILKVGNAWQTVRQKTPTDLTLHGLFPTLCGE